MVPNPELPLAGMADSTYFKVYMSDVGLLRRKSNVNYRTIIDGDVSYIHFKGALTENYIMTQLKYMGIESYFWRTKADAEVDFITDYEGILLPIEVKSADNTRAKSLKVYMDAFKPEYAIKLSSKNFGYEGNKKIVPLYAAFCI